MGRSGQRIAIAGLVALALAACETTAPAPQIPPGVTGGVAIGARAPAAAPSAAPVTQTQTAPVTQPVASGGFTPVAGASATAGLWELRGELGQTCQLNLTATPAGGSFQASPAGLCAQGFTSVAAWSEGSGQLFLFDAQGQLRGRLFPDGVGGFTGNYDDGISSQQLVTLRRL